MKILALETSAKAVSATVSENGRILASGYQDTGLTHSRTLMPIVEHILKNTDLKLSDMDAIASAWPPPRALPFLWTSPPWACPRWPLWPGTRPLPTG